MPDVKKVAVIVGVAERHGKDVVEAFRDCGCGVAAALRSIQPPKTRVW